MDAPPTPCLVDLVHAFKGVVLEQFKKRLEELLSDSILLWRLLKLLFIILLNLKGSNDAEQMPISDEQFRELFHVNRSTGDEFRFAALLRAVVFYAACFRHPYCCFIANQTVTNSSLKHSKHTTRTHRSEQ